MADSCNNNNKISINTLTCNNNSLENLNSLEIYYSVYLSYNAFISKSVRYLKINFKEKEEPIHPILVPATVENIDINPEFSKFIRKVNADQYYYQPSQPTQYKLKKLVIPLNYNCYIQPQTLLPFNILELTMPYNNYTSTLIIPPSR